MELFLNDFYFRREFSELKKLFLHFREGTCKVQKTIASYISGYGTLQSPKLKNFLYFLKK